jgi:hypothetical protein
MEKPFKIINQLRNSEEEWTMDEVLSEINRGCNSRERYNRENWMEGWDDWVEGRGYYSMVNFTNIFCP